MILILGFVYVIKNITLIQITIILVHLCLLFVKEVKLIVRVIV